MHASDLSDDIIQDLTDAFGTLRGTPQSSNSDDQTIDNIDTIVHQALDMTRPE